MVSFPQERKCSGSEGDGTMAKASPEPQQADTANTKAGTSAKGKAPTPEAVAILSLFLG